MFRLKIINIKNPNLLLELVNEFMPPEEYMLVDEDEDLLIDGEETGGIEEGKRIIFQRLKEYTGSAPEWGTLTGVRPVKLAGELMGREGSREAAARLLKDYYLLSEEKIDLIQDIYEYQVKTLGEPKENSCSVYIGIPFCPSRCLYCSFASNQGDMGEINRYVDALIEEIRWASEALKKAEIEIESIYMGGGTPTTPDPDILKKLLVEIRRGMFHPGIREFTVEAGRPDTISPEKLCLLKEYGVDRISINPQSMKEETLRIIGRNHSPEDIERAFGEAKAIGFNSINADVIAGLPGEKESDIIDTVERLIAMGADNITIHSLAVKRASRLKEEDPGYHYKRGRVVREMMDDTHMLLLDRGFIPYYLYRQKHMAGALQNTGYSIPGKEGLYNVRIMDEHQHIMALGAGGISKVYFPENNRLERIANVTNYRQYIERLDEMIDRKKKGFFMEGK